MWLYDVIDVSDSDVVVLHIGVVAIPYCSLLFPYTVGFGCFWCIAEHKHTEAGRSGGKAVKRPGSPIMTAWQSAGYCDGDGIHMALQIISSCNGRTALQCRINGHLFRGSLQRGGCLRHDFRRGLYRYISPIRPRTSTDLCRSTQIHTHHANSFSSRYTTP